MYSSNRLPLQTHVVTNDVLQKNSLKVGQSSAVEKYVLLCTYWAFKD